MVKLLKRFWMEEEGQGMTEYGLIMALIAVVAIVTIIILGNNLKTIFCNIAKSLIASTTC